jgi:hypothetical protein
MKKLLTTTAMVALVASSTAVLAETKIKGSIEQTMINTSYDAAGSFAGTSAIGQETNLSISSSKELDNGWTLSGGFRLEKSAIDNTTIKLSNGGFSIHTGADTGSNIHSNYNPKVGEQPADIISGEAASDGFGSDKQAHDKQHVGVEFKSDLATVFANYAPDSSAAAANGSGTVADGGTSISEVGIKGNLGVEGLNLMVGMETVTGDATTADTDNDVITASYTTGPVAVGFTLRSKDDGAISTNLAEEVQNYSISYKVSDDVSVSYENVEVSFQGSTKTDAEYDQVSVGYNFGGLGVSFDYVTADNVAGTATDDREAFQIRTVYAF